MIGFNRRFDPNFARLESQPSLGSPLAAWHHKILAVIGYCTVWEIEWHWVASWPGIEELREELKDQ